MESALYRGWVSHRRHGPTKNVFRYSVFQLYLDLDELEDVFSYMRVCSIDRPNLVSFMRADHLGDPGLPLDTAVRDLVERETAERPRGPIRLLTHPRYFGYVMNPVSFYYCYDRSGQDVQAIVAEINNTPWGERHCHVLGGRQNRGSAGHHHYRFAKSFHVSPFMPMELTYDWHFSRPGERLTVHMKNIERGERVVFDATLSLARRPLTTRELGRALVQHPFMTASVITAIYWQALRLWLKRAPFYSHPAKVRERSTP